MTNMAEIYAKVNEPDLALQILERSLSSSRAAYPRRSTDSTVCSRRISRAIAAMSQLREILNAADPSGSSTFWMGFYVMPCWKTILNNTTLTVGVTDIFGEDPAKSFSFELGDSIGYPGSLYDNLGRFVYARLIKKF